MPSATPSPMKPPGGIKDKRWEEYQRAITRALREKQDVANDGATEPAASPAPPFTATAEDRPKVERVDVLRAVDQIGKAVAQSLADPAIVLRLCKAIRTAVGADFSYTVGFDPETETCHTLGGDELNPGLVGVVLDATHTRSWTLNSLPTLVGGVAAEIDVAACTLPIGDIYRRLGFQRVLHLPLSRGDEIGGIQLVGRRAANTPFDLNTRAVLDAATPSASLALEIDRVRRQLARSAQVNHYLTANISHELRNTFSVIIGYGEILRDEARQGASLDGANRAMVERLYSATCEGLEILRPAFELSTGLRSDTPVQVEEVDVGQLVDDLVTERFSCQRPEVGIDSNIDPDLPKIRTDAMKLRMILENVLSNAQKFTVAGDITVAAKRDGDKIAVAIRDTGPGISEERLATVFDELSESRPADEDGRPSGLGLYIAKQLADRIGVSLGLESTVGQGTTVTLTLPQDGTG